MDLRLHSILLFLAVVDFLAFAYGGGVGGGGVGVIEVTYKFPGSDRSLSALRAHDVVRHLAILAGVDIPLGGTGRPDSIGLYYAKIGIGTPSKDYYVQVDTGSDITWVNCIQCHECPRRGYHGIELTLYNPNGSSTGKLVSCNHDFCKEIGGGSFSGCTTNASCFYTEVYGDGSYSMGYFVEDIVIYDRVSGDLQTTSANGSVIFGCGARQSGDLGSSDDALDGILGFGKSNSSMISQLAASRRVKKMFAHCLDGVNGGGIFAIGHVVQPQVNMTPLVPDQPHYSVNLTAIQVGLDILNLTTDVNMINDKKGAIIDSGTTLAYLPQEIYVPLVKQILSWQPDLNLQILHDQYTCFDHSGSLVRHRSRLNGMSELEGNKTRKVMVAHEAREKRKWKAYKCSMLLGCKKEDFQIHISNLLHFLDDDFPPVVFHFENSLLLKVYPHEYLFTFEDLTCIGWQNSRYKSNITLLGDLVLSNKLILYDLENQAIGWTEYNCSSTIKLKDELTGSVHLVGAHSISHSSSLNVRVLFFLLMALLHSLLFPPVL